jgi:hypothetical protein
MSMSDLSGWSRSIEAIGKRKEEERVEFNKNLGEPAVFVPDSEDSRFGVGYWRAHNGGVFTYRKYITGYDPYSRVEYPDALIDILVKVRG